jgi:hypothetical protein
LPILVVVNLGCFCQCFGCFATLVYLASLEECCTPVVVVVLLFWARVFPFFALWPPAVVLVLDFLVLLSWFWLEWGHAHISSWFLPSAWYSLRGW